MITRFMDYVRLVLFVCGVLIGIQVPAFVEQYGQRLEAHQQEAKLALATFQKDADRYFSGDLSQLVAHYKKNNDPVITDGGHSIDALIKRYTLLTDALTQFRQNQYSPYQQILLQPQRDIQVEVWQGFTHVIVLKPDAIAIGAFIGFLIALLCDLILGCFFWGCRRIFSFS